MGTVFPYKESFLTDFPGDFCGRGFFLGERCEEGVYCWKLAKPPWAEDRGRMGRAGECGNKGSRDEEGHRDRDGPVDLVVL